MASKTLNQNLIMSHFSVLVIGPDPEEQLAPYHEFECTGVVDQYVINVDKLADVRREYDENSERRLKSPSGELFYPYEDQFYREFTPEEIEKISPLGHGFGHGLSWFSKDWGDGRGYRAKVQFVPEGFTEVQVNSKEIRTFAEFVAYEYEMPVVAMGEHPDIHGEHKFGWCRLNESGEVIELVDRTNPNAKWDYYRLVDQAKKGEIDFQGKMQAAGEDAQRKYRLAMRLFEGLEPNKHWSAILEEIGNNDKARVAYWNQPRCSRWKANEQNPVFEAICVFRSSPDEFLVSEEEYISAAREASIRTFAVVKDRKWFEKGKMGWWASVTNEKDPGTWNSIFVNLLKDLADDTLLSIFDCHI